MRALATIAALLLASCAREPGYVDGLLLRDRDGCAFTARAGAGETIFLTFNRQESGPNCKYPTRP